MAVERRNRGIHIRELNFRIDGARARFHRTGGEIFMSDFEQILNTAGSIVWGPWMISLLVGTGILVTFRSGLIQFRGFFRSLQIVFTRSDSESTEGEISPFEALSSALSATIGTGNIAGVATAIASGGPGALFWMWVTALVGMATKFATAVLAVKFRRKRENGRYTGGPMVYLEDGLGSALLGKLFAIFTIIASFGIGNMVQANSAAAPLKEMLGISPYITGPVMALITGLVMIGGIKRIGIVAGKIVPFMALFYLIGALWALFTNLELVPGVIGLIFASAFEPTAAMGGFAGAAVRDAIRYGVARGVFSNEAGLGSAPIAHAAAKTDDPVKQGLVAMLGPFIDTLVICSLTGFVILVSGEWVNGANGATLSAMSFEKLLPGFGAIVVQLGILFFAFSTILGWSYYGDRSVEYLFGQKYVPVYHAIWVILIPIGAIMKLDLVWSLSDVANGLMAAPNLIGVVLLSGVVARETKRYFS